MLMSVLVGGLGKKFTTSYIKREKKSCIELKIEGLHSGRRILLLINLPLYIPYLRGNY